MYYYVNIKLLTSPFRLGRAGKAAISIVMDTALGLKLGSPLNALFSQVGALRLRRLNTTFALTGLGLESITGDEASARHDGLHQLHGPVRFHCLHAHTIYDR